MILSDLHTGEEAIITKVKGIGAFKKRIIEMGFVKGQMVKVIKNAPLKDPIEYAIMGYNVSLRRHEASFIEVITKEEAKDTLNGSFNGVINEDILRETAQKKVKTINLAIVGNPNAGKTTLYNYISGSKEHVGNYGGVTVDQKTTTFTYKGYTFNLTDLPGTYSLSAYSPEEIYVRNFIQKETPDIVINVVDASNLERNLYLTTQLIDMDVRVVIALNMYDELIKTGDNFNYIQLGKMLGIPFVPTVSRKGTGIDKLFDTLICVYSGESEFIRHVHINYGKAVENSIKTIRKVIDIPENIKFKTNVSGRHFAIRMLEKDQEAQRKSQYLPNKDEVISVVNKEIDILEKTLLDDTETLITDARYGFISGALKETYKESHKEKRKTTEIIDAFITNKVWGFPIFFFLMWLMFFTTFKVGQYPMDWIDWGVLQLSNFLSNIMPEGPLKALLIDGVIGGVGSVIIFLPNILILFFFISLFEDTGYMSRAAFIMDKVMHKIGLHGKSFIPLIMGFGCNVPAIMATRIIENPKNKILTILINPFMSCSARLPVYLLIIGAFFPENAGTILFLVYIIGIALAIILALVFKRLFFKTNEIPFVMELPPYRMPTLRTILKHMWNKASQYLQKMGGIILVAVIIIWALSYYPRNIELSTKHESGIQKIELEYTQKIENFKVDDILILKNIEQKKLEELSNLEQQYISETQSKSYLGRIGHFIEPAIRPLGFDWKMGVSLLSGIAAKEIVVSTMGVLFQAENVNNAEATNLADKLQQSIAIDKYGNEKPLFNKASAFAFLMFILIYFPCIAVVSAISKETGSWKWALFTVVYTTGLAWIIAFAANQIGSLFL